MMNNELIRNAKCEECDKTDNLWMNLTDGKILCGRKYYDGKKIDKNIRYKGLEEIIMQQSIINYINIHQQ